MEKKIKRLEIAVVVLSILFVFSIFVSVYAATQIRLIADKIPNYTEVKSDIKLLKTAYNESAKKADSLHIKDKVVKGYDYTVDKASEFVGYLKEQKEKRHDK